MRGKRSGIRQISKGREGGKVSNMWECSFANEPVDFKLLVLFFLRKIWIFAAAVLTGALLVGGGYFVKNVVLVPEKEYQTVGEVYVDYVWEDAYGISRSNLNEGEWKALVKTDIFVDYILEQLAGQGILLEKSFIRESVDAALVSDSRIVTTMVVTDSPELSAAIGSALQEALLFFGEDNSRIERIRVLTEPVESRIVVHDIRTLQAAVLGAVLGGLLYQAFRALTLALFKQSYRFSFVFSLPALGLTVACFALIYLFALRRSRKYIRKAKIHDLIYADRLNEGVVI